MTLTHAPLFVALMMLLLTLLGMNSSRMRVKLKIFYADGGNLDMRAAERAHGNGVEHMVPLSILLVLLELGGVSKQAIVVLGVLCVLIRLAKAAGTVFRVRQVGAPLAGLTYGLELVMSGWLIATASRLMR